MYTKKAKEMRHIVPITLTINSKSDLSVNSLTSCERPCVCVCVCKHGGSKALDFENNQEKIKSKALYKEFLETQHFKNKTSG